MKTTPQINDGGPAFPCETYGLRNGKETTIPTNGMSLRDYFAGQALAGSLASQTPESYWAFVSSGSAANDSAKNGIAKLCYDLADAMLAAREVKP